MTVDLDRATLTEAIGALESGQISSVELLHAQLDRVDTFNPSVNAVVSFDVERAQEVASAVDRRRAAGEPVGPLAGVPLTIKDTYETEGLVTTAGAPGLAEHVPTLDADVVQGLRAADAIIYGKTNTPLYAGDQQTYNDVHGLTRNPWDPERTAGGSSGGAAVSVACGFSLGEVGSDIGGSIRVPAHFNGIFGLKPTWGVISGRGHIPGPPGTLGAMDLGVMGPLGRSVADLELLLDACLLVDPFGGVPGATLPSAAPVDLGTLRFGLWTTDPMSPVSTKTQDALSTVAKALDESGALVDPDVRPSIPASELHDTYGRLLAPVMSAGLPAAVIDRLKAVAEAAPNALDAADSSTFATRSARDMVSLHRDWLGADELRARARASWASLFDAIDVMIMPVSQTAAFRHDVEVTYSERMVSVDDGERPYHEILFWAGLATMPGLPSVVIPTGHVDGLPIGVQLVGPRWSDRGLLAIARSVCDVVGSQFAPPTLITG